MRLMWVLVCWICAGCLQPGSGLGKTTSPQPPPTMKDYSVYEKLSSALTGDEFTMFAIRELFFPSVGQSPVCVPITYQVTCANASSPFNASFLWTEYNSELFVGQLLLSSAYYGVVLDGFDWVSYCWFFENADAVQVLNLNVSLPCSGLESVVSDQLHGITALLKSYASGSGSISGSSITEYRAYALKMNETDDTSSTIFHKSQVVLSVIVAMLNVFILTFSLGICGNLYDAIYDEIKCKKNPYYPLFWSVVILSMLWNFGPAWLVLSLDSPHIRYSLASVIPIQLILALFVKKYPEFPIPGMKWWTLPQIIWSRLQSPDEKMDEDDDSPPPPKNFFWEVCSLRKPARAIVSFIFQTIAIWSLLVLFTFVVYYSLTVAISLYLYPIETLVKILFIKAVAVCTIFDVALLFSGPSLDYHCSKKAFVLNVTLVSQVLAVLSFLPVLAFLAYTIGGVIFSVPSNQLNGVQGIIALLPSAFLVLVGWYSRGTIFPEKLPDEKSGSEPGHLNTNTGEFPAHSGSHGTERSKDHPTAIHLEHEIGELAGHEGGSGRPHLSEQTPLIHGKKA